MRLDKPKIMLGFIPSLDGSTHPDGDALTAVRAGGFYGPDNGTLQLNSDGPFVYTPEFDFVGSTGFVYHAFDGLIDSNQRATQIIVRE